MRKKTRNAIDLKDVFAMRNYYLFSWYTVVNRRTGYASLYEHNKQRRGL